MTNILTLTKQPTISAAQTTMKCHFVDGQSAAVTAFHQFLSLLFIIKIFLFRSLRYSIILSSSTYLSLHFLLTLILLIFLKFHSQN